MALLVVFPLQVAILAATYQVATSAAPANEVTSAGPDPDSILSNEKPGEAALSMDDRGLTVRAEGGDELRVPADAPVAALTPARMLARWVRVGGVALLMVAPPVVGAAAVMANPRGLPAATVARPEAGFSSRPLDLTVLADGTVATVDAMQIGLCSNADCANVGLVSMPCLGGGEPVSMGEGVRGCSIEAPLAAADITPDGTLLALNRGQGNTARFFWCRMTATPETDSADGAERSSCTSCPSFGRTGR